MFARERYINLRTFKKDFGAIDTPLWFVTFPDRPDKFFAFTNCMSGKIKRIKNNNAAEITRTGLVEKTGNNIADDFASGSAFFLKLLTPAALPNECASLEIGCLIY